MSPCMWLSILALLDSTHCRRSSLYDLTRTIQGVQVALHRSRSLLSRRASRPTMQHGDLDAVEQAIQLTSNQGYMQRKVAARDSALANSGMTNEIGIPIAGDGMVYGEFDLTFFKRLLVAAQPREGDHFYDLGSGYGRLVLAAALLYPDLWNSCTGVELLPELYNAAMNARSAFEQIDALSAMPIAPVDFKMADVYEIDLSAADVCFSYSVTWDQDLDGLFLTTLSEVLGKNCKEGTRVITIDLKLRDDSEGRWHFKLLEEIRGYNDETGESIGYIWLVANSLS